MIEASEEKINKKEIKGMLDRAIYHLIKLQRVL